MKPSNLFNGEAVSAMSPTHIVARRLSAIAARNISVSAFSSSVPDRSSMLTSGRPVISSYTCEK